MQKLVLKLGLLFLTIVFPLFIYNYYTDYYGIFKKELENRLNEPNIRFIKTQYVVNNPEKYNAFIFGSSRVGKILANLESENVYNMYYSEGLPIEFLEDINTFIANEVSIKKVYIGLDEISFKIIPAKHKTQLLRRRFYGNFSNDVISYLEYLLDPPKIFIASFSVPTTFDYLNTGCPLHYEVDSIINRDPELHVNHQKFSNPKMYYGDRSSMAISEIRELINVCLNQGIEVVVFFNPVFINTYAQYQPDYLADIKRKLTSVTSFYDFSGVTPITTDPIHYYESSHYRYSVGDSIWLTISGKTYNKDHVTYVDSLNIENHLLEEQHWLKNFNSNKSF
ncbi:MAG: hypothetical protein AAF901_08900 [Bacteroidota bacterium]